MFKGSLETTLRIKLTDRQVPIYQLGLTCQQSSYFATEVDPAAGIYNCIILNLPMVASLAHFTIIVRTAASAENVGVPRGAGRARPIKLPTPQ